MRLHINYFSCLVGKYQWIYVHLIYDSVLCLYVVAFKLATLASSVGHRAYIYSSEGRLLSSFAVDDGIIAGFGFTNVESICVVYDDGTIRVYGIFGNLVRLYSLPPETVEDGVAEVAFCDVGLVARTTTNSFYSVYNIDSDVMIEKLAGCDVLLKQPPLAIVAIPVKDGNDKVKIEVLAAGLNGSIISIDKSTAVDLNVPNGPFTILKLSPKGSFLALFSTSGTLSIVSADCSRFISEFSTSATLQPHQIAWCGEDSVLMRYEKMLLMVGPLGDFVKWTYDEPSFIVTEVDGARVMSSACEWISRVAASTENIFKLGSVAGPALLFDACEAFTLGDIKSNDNVRAIEDMAAAVDACLEAATLEWDGNMQRQLLSAASFGKSFLEDYNPDSFVDACIKLRILNSVRREVGMPITLEQYHELTPESLIARLIARRDYSLALAISTSLGFKPDLVVLEWASVLIRDSLATISDTMLYEKILSKSKLCGKNLAFVTLAAAAVKNRRRELAILLLAQEASAHRSLPFYLEIGEYDIALKVATDSGDCDLVYLCLLHMQPLLEANEFIRIVIKHPVAAKLYVSYCRKTGNLDWLKNYYHACDEPKQAADVLVLEAYACSSLESRIRGLEIAEGFYKKFDTFVAKALQVQLNLLVIQREEDKRGNNFADLSLTSMMEKCIAKNNGSVSQLKTLFNVPDMRYCHILVKILAKCKRWSDLHDIKNPCIGYLPFVEACMEEKEYTESYKYILLLPDTGDQYEYMCAIGYYREAAELAWSLKDFDALANIRAVCKSASVNKWIDSLQKK